MLIATCWPINAQLHIHPRENKDNGCKIPDTHKTLERSIVNKTRGCPQAHPHRPPPTKRRSEQAHDCCHSTMQSSAAPKTTATAAELMTPPIGIPANLPHHGPQHNQAYRSDTEQSDRPKRDVETGKPTQRPKDGVLLKHVAQFATTTADHDRF